MPPKPSKTKVRHLIWRKLSRLLGEHPELAAARTALGELNARLQAEQNRFRERTAQLEAALDRVREERLGWQAKESSTRKELQDTQARAKDLLEQVVQLTHRQRQTQKSLLDQQFKTETTPLERNRFEMELTEARGRARRAEERAKQAEADVARARKSESQARKQASRVKDLQSQLAWANRQVATLQQALAASIDKVRDLEERIEELAPPRGAGPAGRRRYRRPSIRSRQGAADKRGVRRVAQAR